MKKKNESGLISKEDYEQVFEETVMSVIEGLVNHGKKAEIKNTVKIIKKWAEYFWMNQ